MDSKTVCRCSEAFNLSCSIVKSWFSLSAFALANALASDFLASNLDFISISCSIVAVIKKKKINMYLVFKIFHYN